MVPRFNQLYKFFRRFRNWSVRINERPNDDVSAFPPNVYFRDDILTVTDFNMFRLLEIKVNAPRGFRGERFGEFARKLFECFKRPRVVNIYDEITVPGRTSPQRGIKLSFPPVNNRLLGVGGVKSSANKRGFVGSAWENWTVLQHWLTPVFMLLYPENANKGLTYGA